MIVPSRSMNSTLFISSRFVFLKRSQQRVILIRGPDCYSQAAVAQLQIAAISDHYLLAEQVVVDSNGIRKFSKQKICLGRVDLGNDRQTTQRICKGITFADYLSDRVIDL